jgi:3-isopropylmalate dehydrogenase
MLLRSSLQLTAEADAIEQAVSRVLKAGYRTRDIAGGGEFLSTTAMGDKVIAELQQG